jgi:hypothetical protein
MVMLMIHLLDEPVEPVLKRISFWQLLNKWCTLHPGEEPTTGSQLNVKGKR